MTTERSVVASGHLTRSYDHANRRLSKRSGRERGVWVYVPAAELIAAGFDPSDPSPSYTTTGFQRSKNARTIIVSLFARDPD